jgi:NAD(P)-dependent dehydrogenase (short-subunit alcohol dehydrogenase family)
MLNDNQLQGKVALVTGAGGDIGSATVRLMLARGARVVGIDRDPQALARLRAGAADQERLLTLEGNVADEASVRDVVAAAKKSFGRVDVIFNNAGIEGPVRPLTEYSLADFQRVMDVNVIGVFLGMKYAIPEMLAVGGGAIINTSSTAGLSGARGVCAYNASKHAVIGLTRSAAVEWAGKGIRINAIAPGPISSRMIRQLEEGFAPGKADELHAQMAAGIPAGRYGDPEEVATLVAFLASQDARYLNGGVYSVDGGRMAR